MYKFGKVKVYLISGKAGTGKSTFAGLLYNHVRNITSSVYIDHFARRVKEIAYSQFGWNGIKDSRGRKLLQDIGNTARRYNEDFWALEVLRTLETKLPNVLIVDDWRYPNEWAVLKECGFTDIVRIRIDAPDREIIPKDSPQYLDISETALDDFQFDFFIENSDLTIDSLDSVAEEIVRGTL